MAHNLFLITLFSLAFFVSSCTGFQPLMSKDGTLPPVIDVETGNESVDKVSDSLDIDLFSSSHSQQALTFAETDQYSVDGRNNVHSSPLVRIALAPKATTVSLSSTTGFEYVFGREKTKKRYPLAPGTYQISRSGSLLILKGPNKKIKVTPPLILTPVTPKGSWSYATKRYGGKAIVSTEGNGILLNNVLPVEEYLRGVVPLEIGKRSFKELEALKAQAIAARTYTYSRMQARKTESYDLLSTVADQVYGGVGKAQPTTDSAIGATAGLVLVDSEQKFIGAFYHSTCGGTTASINQVWSGPKVPYLQSVSDKDSHGKAWCSASSKMNWTVRWSVAQLSQTIAHYSAQLKEQPFRGTISAIRVTKRTSSGRVLQCAVTSEYGTYYYGKDKIRQILRRPQGGAPLLWSASFSIKKQGSTIIATGHGFGHGIGMCQFGALGRAQGGQLYTEILNAYYKGAHLKKVVVK